MSVPLQMKDILISALKSKVEHQPHFLEELKLITNGKQLTISVIDHFLNFLSKICQIWVFYELFAK